MRRFFTIFAALFAFVGCSQDDVATPNAPIEKPTYYASFADAEADSRTYLDENFMLLWHNDDRISLFATTYNEEYAFADAPGSNSGAFNAVDKDSYVTGNAISTTYAVYPYNAANAISNSEILTIHFPAEQSYAEDSFGRGANTMVAAAQSSSSKLLPFRNAGGYMMLKLYGENKTVKSIELKGNNEEVISGAATAEAKYGYLPLITMGAEGGKSITLTCENAVELGATEAEATTFWIVVPPITFEEGFTITVTDADGGTYTKSTSKPTTINRNEIKSMSALAPTFTGETENPGIQEVPETWKIYYTATEKVEIDSWNKDTFGANIVSNEWDETTSEGVITFDGEVTKIGANAFKNCTALKEIVIDNSIIEIGASAFYGCSGLTSTTVGASIQKIGLLAFENCTGKLIVKSNHDYYNLKSGAVNGVFYKSKFTTVVIEEGVTVIGKDAFYNCPVTSLTLPSTLKIIRRRAFSGIKIQSLTIPESVSTIETEGFSWCDNLKNVYLNPSTPPATGSYDNGYESNWRAFYHNSSGRVIYVPEESYYAYITAQGWRYYGYTILKPGEELNDKQRIDNRMMWYTTSDNSANGFWWDSSYWGGASVVFNGYDVENNMGFLVFDKALTEIRDNDNGFGNDASEITTLTIPKSVNKISYYPLNLCSIEAYYGPLATADNKAIILGTTLVSYAKKNTATSYTIPNSITIIGESAFDSALNLTDITVPDSVVEIGSSAFNNSKIVNIVLNGVETVGDQTFGNCSKLRSVTMGSNTKSIGYWAFANCSNLNEIYCKATTPPTIVASGSGDARLFGGSSFGGYIYVPSSSYSEYKYGSEDWSDYSSYIRSYY